jgi:Tfp pilus assembly protein PilN
MLINLLPPRQKEEIIEERKWKTFFILGILSLVFLFSLVLVFLAIEINIRGEAKSMEIIIASEEKELETSEIKTLGEKIKLFNDDLAELNDFYGKQRSSAGPLLDIASLLPGGVYLTNISLGDGIFLSGRSGTRDDLVAFKKNLESNQSFSGINFPSSSWAKSKDIDFTVSFKVKK